MIQLKPDFTPSIWSDVPLWGGSFVFVVALHAMAFVSLQPDRSEREGAGDPAVTIELESDSSAPIQGRSELTPGPEQIQTDQISQASVAQQQVVESTQKEKEANPPKVDVATAPDPEVAMPDVQETLDVKPKEEQQQKEKDNEKQQQSPSEAHVESAPTSAPQTGPVVSPQIAVSAGTAVDDTAAVVTWRARLSAHVQRFKRYPAEALEKHLHGTAMVRFTIDRAGTVLSAEIVSRSGTEILDRESLSLITRAAPLPAPPTHVRGTHFTFSVPVRFQPQR
jgi:protein TonB